MATELNGTQAYRFELFEPQQAMPAPKRKSAPVGPQRVVEAPKKTKAQLKAEAKAINRRIAVILSVAAYRPCSGGSEDTDEYLRGAEQNGRPSEQTDSENGYGRYHRLCDEQIGHGQGHPFADKLHNRQRFRFRCL